MSIIKSLYTEVNKRPIQIVFPEKKTLILKGGNNTHILHILECLLAKDFTNYYRLVDKQKGFEYDEPTGVSQLEFNDSVIVGKDGSIFLQGRLPNIHCIRYIGSGYSFRSFCIHKSDAFNQIYTDMTVYSSVIPENSWIRLITLVNNIIGQEVVRLENNNLVFNFLENYSISVDGQRFIYMLIAECFLTPTGYSRVLLLPNIPCLSTDMQIKLLSVLDNITSHSLTLSTVNANIQDLRNMPAISILNI